MISRGRRYLVLCILLLRMLRNRMPLREEMLFYGGTMRRTTRIIFQLGIRLEFGARKCLGINLFGSHKEYRAMPSLFGWHWGQTLYGSSHEAMGDHTRLCVLWWARREQGPPVFVCPFTFTIWTTLTDTLLGTAVSPDWTTTVQSLLMHNRHKLDIILFWLVFHTTLLSCLERM